MTSDDTTNNSAQGTPGNKNSHDESFATSLAIFKTVILGEGLTTLEILNQLDRKVLPSLSVEEIEKALTFLLNEEYVRVEHGSNQWTGTEDGFNLYEEFIGPLIQK